MEFENLLTLIKAVSDSELTELHYESDGAKIDLKKEQPCVVQAEAPVVHAAVTAAAAPVPAPASETAVAGAQEEPEGMIVKSPLVGTFYAAPAEDADPFVAVGDTVKKGQTLAIVEAMKLMNEIESDYNGKIAEIYVENGQAVEYGQPLFRIV